MIALLVAFAVCEIAFPQHVRVALVFAGVATFLVCERRFRAEDAPVALEDDIAPSPAAAKVSGAKPAKRGGSHPSTVRPGSVAEKLLRRATEAFGRKALIEAHYWAMKSVLADGGATAQREMSRYRSTWVAAGGPRDPGGFRADYTEDCELISVAVLWLTSDLNVMRAKSRLRRFASAGNEDAAAYLTYLRRRR